MEDIFLLTKFQTEEDFFQIENCLIQITDKLIFNSITQLSHFTSISIIFKIYYLIKAPQLIDNKNRTHFFQINSHQTSNKSSSSHTINLICIIILFLSRQQMNPNQTKVSLLVNNTQQKQKQKQHSDVKYLMNKNTTKTSNRHQSKSSYDEKVKQIYKNYSPSKNHKQSNRYSLLDMNGNKEIQNRSSVDRKQQENKERTRVNQFPSTNLASIVEENHSKSNRNAKSNNKLREQFVNKTVDSDSYLQKFGRKQQVVEKYKNITNQSSLKQYTQKSQQNTKSPSKVSFFHNKYQKQRKFHSNIQNNRLQQRLNQIKTRKNKYLKISQQITKFEKQHKKMHQNSVKANHNLLQKQRYQNNNKFIDRLIERAKHKQTIKPTINEKISQSVKLQQSRAKVALINKSVNIKFLPPMVFQ